VRKLAIRASLGLALAMAALLAPQAAPAGSPAGATARCRDGTYSFSRTRSGTCSHHGGVARWLTGPTPAASSRPTSSAGPTIPAVIASTKLLAPIRARSGCHVHGALPDRRCSPGAISTAATLETICTAGYAERARKVSQATKDAVYREYGLAPGHRGRSYEIDHIVPLELGGSNDRANLYPEAAFPRPGYHEKDRLENELHRLICARRLTLAGSQRAIATNWLRLYRTTFGAASF
jgi:hypothetical protein